MLNTQKTKHTFSNAIQGFKGYFSRQAANQSGAPDNNVVVALPAPVGRPSKKAVILNADDIHNQSFKECIEQGVYPV